MIRLFGLLEQHGEAVEADLAFRGIDLRGLWTGELTWRRLGVLVANLPPESATQTVMREALTDDELEVLTAAEPTSFGAWSRVEYLLAGLNDRASDLFWLMTYLKTDLKKSPAPERPEPYPRPGLRKKNPFAQDPAAVAYLQRIRDAHKASLTLDQDGA
jgi:hypothetical protein